LFDYLILYPSPKREGHKEFLEMPISKTFGLSDVTGVIAGVVSLLQANGNNRRNVIVLKVMLFFI
jgi:hypothetical protein